MTQYECDTPTLGGVVELGTRCACDACLGQVPTWWAITFSLVVSVLFVALLFQHIDSKWEDSP